MAVASIHLDEQETQALQVLEQQTGKTQEELLREAINQLLANVQSANRLVLLRAARGMWKDRADLPSAEALRAEFDRFASWG